jgi:hypothetical protein
MTGMIGMKGIRGKRDGERIDRAWEKGNLRGRL